MSQSLEFQDVAVIGAGTMGAGIAQVCAQNGSNVVLYDVDQPAVDRGLQSISAFLEKGVQKGKVEETDAAATLGRIRVDLDLASAVKRVDLVVEAVPEKLELKRGVFADIADACGPVTVLATNTSSLSIARIFAGIEGRGRCLGMHFFNPVPLMALLEVVRTDDVDSATVDRVVRYGVQIGKEPIVVADSPGFASSRLGVCLGLEAIRMVEAGVASPSDIDKAMELGYRHPMGPLRLTDVVGLDVRMAIADYLREELGSPAFDVPQLMRDMVRDGKLGKKSGRGFYEW